MKHISTVETRLLRNLFSKSYKIQLTDEQLTDIDLIYFDLRKENILDIFVYRLINIVLFILFVLASIFFTRKVIINLSVIFLVYNVVHSARTYLRYYRAIKHYEEWKRN